MQPWCLSFALLLLLLVITIWTSSANSFDANRLQSIDQDSTKHRKSSSITRTDRSVAKRSQRNANILYRFCRQSGEAPQFCLKYAVRMLFATGH